MEGPTGRAVYGRDGAADRLISLTDHVGKVTSYGYDSANHRNSAALTAAYPGLHC